MRLLSGLLVLMIGLIIPVTRVAAETMDVNFYSQNDILYYDPNSTGVQCSTTGASSSGSGTTSANEDKNAESVLRYFTGKGMTLAQASGFVGNMHAESTINPRSIQNSSPTTNDNYQPVGGTGFGLVQWTSAGRQQNLVNLAKSTNRPTTDINLQLDYVWQELNTGYKATIQTLASLKDITPEQAAIIVHGRTVAVSGDPRFAIAPALGYEASGDSVQQVMDNRAAFATKYYNMFKGKISDGNGIQGAPTTSIPAISAGGCNTGSTSTGPTGKCSVTSPIYGEGGNAHQLTTAELTKVYGPPNDAASYTTMDFFGKSVQVNKVAADCLQAVIDEMKANKITDTYPIVTAGCYRHESMDIIMYHGFGAACDINAADNPCAQCGVNPKNLAPGTYNMPQAIIDAFHHHGWSWGGNWSTKKDYMHFEFNGAMIP